MVRIRFSPAALKKLHRFRRHVFAMLHHLLALQLRSLFT